MHNVNHIHNEISELKQKISTYTKEVYDWESKFHFVLNEENEKTWELRIEIEKHKKIQNDLDHKLHDLDDKFLQKERYFKAEIH